MLRILHTADWHLGKVFRHTDFSLLSIQESRLKELVSLVEENEVDLVLIAGDVFDAYNPPFRAETLFYRILLQLSGNGRRPVIVCAGNHDAPEKFEAPRPLLKRNPGIIMLSRPEESLKDFAFKTPYYEIKPEGHFLKISFPLKRAHIALKILPFPSETRWGLAGEEFKSRLASFLKETPSFTADHYLLVSHLWVEEGRESGSERLSFLGGAEKVPLDLLPPEADLVALGHLHRFQKVGSNVCYAGSIFPFTIKEAEHEKGVFLWEDGKETFLPFQKGPRVKEYRFEEIKEALEAAEDLKNELVFLRFPPLAPSTKEIARLKQVYSGRLLGLHFEVPEPEEENFSPSQQFKPEELFKQFWRQKDPKGPEEELISLFLRFLSKLQNQTLS